MWLILRSSVAVGVSDVIIFYTLWGDGPLGREKVHCFSNLVTREKFSAERIVPYLVPAYRLQSARFRLYLLFFKEEILGERERGLLVLLSKLNLGPYS